jgi:phenylacetate-CoA ligase
MYSRFLRSILIPAYYTLRGRRYHRYRQFVERSQWWSQERLLDFQWEETKKLLQHAFATVPFYQKKYGSAGFQIKDIQTRADFAMLPPLTREEVNKYSDELKSAAFSGKLLPHATGGSSGVPTRFFITYESFDWRMAVSSRAYTWSGCNLGERTLCLWGAPVGHVPRVKALKKSLYESLRREKVFNTFAQDEKLWRSIYFTALGFRPQLIVGYVSSLEQFCHFLLDNNLKLHPIRAVIAAAEPVFQPVRELVAKALGAELFNTYGSREFMSIGAECEFHNGLHLNAENLFVELEMPSTEPSEILITDLHNYGMPFIRYRIGDLGILADSAPCECGRGLPRIHSIEGRTLDVLRTRTGRVVPGELFPHIMKDIAEVVEFQAHQVNLDEIILLVVVRQPWSQKSRLLLANEFYKVFGSEVKITVKEVGEIPRRPSGKRRVTVGLGT